MTKTQPRYAAERVSVAMVRVVLGDGDPRTVIGWGQQLGVSRTTLVTWCRGTDVSAKAALDLARLLRAVILDKGSLTSLLQVLDIAEPRTAARLLRRAGLRSTRLTGNAAELLRLQRLVRNSALLDSLQRRLLDAGFS